MLSSSTSKQPTIYKKNKSLKRKPELKTVAPKWHQKLPVVSFKHAVFFSFSFLRGQGSDGGKKGVVIFLQGSSLAVYIDLKQQNGESGCGMCRGRGLPLWHSRLRCHGDRSRGLGPPLPDLAPQRPQGLELGCFPKTPRAWRPELRGLLYPGGLWESHSGPSPKSLSLKLLSLIPLQATLSACY